ncbi:hypothetical protein CRUP_030681 [Coryphaenoides rupestris]|nr:hypothetical protein CRUP_030681 [Coryphaenoides rupestris]
MPSVTKSSQPRSRKRKHARKASKETIPPPQRTEATRTQTVIWPAPPRPAQLNPALPLLLETLEHLGKAELKRFMFYLRELKMSPYEPIAQSRLEDKDILDLVDVMLNHYGSDAMLQVTLQILPMIPRRDLLADLEKKIGREII